MSSDKSESELGDGDFNAANDVLATSVTSTDLLLIILPQTGLDSKKAIIVSYGYAMQQDWSYFGFYNWPSSVD